MDEMVDIKSLLGKYLNGESSLMSNEEYEKSKLDAFNNREGDRKYIDCKVCRNKGEVAVMESGRMVIKECGCMVKRRAMKRMLDSGLDSVIRRYTFGNYNVSELWQKTALEKCKEYIENPKGWLVMSGSPGTGKTHLCTAVCGDLIKQGYDVRYFQWRSDAPVLKASAGTMEYEDRVKPFKRAKVLYIDDFFKSRTVTDGDINLAFDILNARYNDINSLTIISSELTLDEMLDIDEALGSRIVERKSIYISTVGKDNWRVKGEEN